MTLPAVDPLVHRLPDEVERTSGELSRRDLLGWLDDLRAPLHELLADCYGDGYYAKLLYLKLTNYLVSRYEFHNRHLRLAARPVTLLVDPTNGCQLACPGCVHSTNPKLRDNVDWPIGTMRLPTFQRLLESYGPLALSTVLYNYGEPLLNKEIGDFVTAANSYGVSSSLSTNLALKFDVERFVRSGPGLVILSIDGVTQETYGRFRKRGDLAMALANLRRLVETRERLGLTRPLLVWRFLTFEHNVHEAEAAIRLGREIGVDYVLVSRPFDVSHDDPGVRVAVSEHEGRHDVRPERRRTAAEIRRHLVRHEAVERCFDEGWLERGAEAGLDESRSPDGGTCVWLYFNLTVDAVGRVMPCCISPAPDKHLVFDRLGEDVSDLINGPEFRTAREHFVDRQSLEGNAGDGDAPYCATCPSPPTLTYETHSGMMDLMELDYREVLFNDATSPQWWRLAHWE